MNMIYLAALMIGGTTLAGTACGFLLNNVSKIWNDIVTAFAAGVMLCAAVFGLFAPAMEMGAGTWMVVSGALAGMVFLKLVAKMVPRGMLSLHPELLFVAALVMHKFPEGMAGGIGIGGGGMMVAAGVAIQNLPEGVIMIPPLLNAGISRRRAALIALFTGLLNALGVLAGGLWGALSGNVLPFALSFAGGAMLYVIVRNMIPCVFASGRLRHCEWILMGGFLTMVAVNMLF